MTLANVPSLSRRPKDDFLTRTADRLCQVLAEAVLGREQQWAEAVGTALTEVEKSLRQYQVAAATPDGPLAEVDQTRPTLRRQSAAWRHDLAKLLDQCLALEDEVRHAAQAFRPTADTLLERTGTEGIPVFGAIRQRVEEWVAGLRQIKEDEAAMVLESVNTDIGVGD
jgi:hypothetical protein